MRVRVTLQEFKRVFYEVAPTLMDHPHPETFAYRTVEIEAEPIEEEKVEDKKSVTPIGFRPVWEMPEAERGLDIKKEKCDHEMVEYGSFPDMKFGCVKCGLKADSKRETQRHYNWSDPTTWHENYKGDRLNQEFDNIYAILRGMKNERR